MSNELEEEEMLRRIFCQTSAQILMSRFPGLEIVPLPKWKYALCCHEDHNFDRQCSIEQLEVETKSMLDELRSRYGPHGEHLYERHDCS